MSPVAVNVLDKPVIAVVLLCSDIVLYGVVRRIKLSIKLLVYPISEAVVAVKIARLKVSGLTITPQQLIHFSAKSGSFARAAR